MPASTAKKENGLRITRFEKYNSDSASHSDSSFLSTGFKKIIIPVLS